MSVNKGIPRTCTSPKISRFRAPGAFTIQPAASFSSAIFREDRTGVPTLLPLWHAHCVNSRTCNPPNHRHPSAEIPPPPFVAPTWTARQVSWSLNLPGGTYYLVTTAVSNSSGGVPAAGGPGPDCSAADDAGGAKWRVMDTRTNMFWNTPW